MCSLTSLGAQTPMGVLSEANIWNQASWDSFLSCILFLVVVKGNLKNNIFHGSYFSVTIIWLKHFLINSVGTSLRHLCHTESSKANSLQHPHSSQDLLTVTPNVWCPSAVCVPMLWLFTCLESFRLEGPTGDPGVQTTAQCRPNWLKVLRDLPSLYTPVAC